MARKRPKLPILALLSTAQLIIILDFSIVNVALPSIQAQFDLAPTTLQWVVSAYALTFGGFLLLGGRLSDIFDRKKTFLAGLVIFTAASFLGGLAPSALAVFVSRAAQGLGAAILSPSALSLITTNFEEGQERNLALGVFSSMAAIGFILGVTIGGALTSFISWHWVFFVNVPIGIATFLLAFFIIPSQPKNEPKKGFDVTGAVLVTTSILIVVYAISQIPNPSETIEDMALLIVLAAIVFGSFLYAETRASRPLVPLDVFRRRTMLLADLIMFVAYWANAASIFTLTLYFQDARGLSPVETGLLFVPGGLGGVTGALLAPRAIKRIGFVPMILVGLVVFGSTLWILASLMPTSDLLPLLVVYYFVGVGIVSTIVSLTVAATTGMERHRQGLAAGMLTTAQQIGAAIGVSMASVVITAVGLSQGQTLGLQASIVMSVVLAFIGAFLTALIIVRRWRRAVEGMPSMARWRD